MLEASTEELAARSRKLEIDNAELRQELAELKPIVQQLIA